MDKEEAAHRWAARRWRLLCLALLVISLGIMTAHVKLDELKAIQCQCVKTAGGEQ